MAAMLEALTIQRHEPQAFTVASITRSGSTATVTTVAPHGFATNDRIAIAGATQSDYNAARAAITVTGTRTFTYSVSGSPATPATGTITATYVSDAQGGRRLVWRTLATVRAELIPQRFAEREVAEAIQSDTSYRFKVRVRDDVTPKMRALWTPRWPPSAAVRTLEIAGVVPVDGRMFLLLECSDSARPAA